MTDELDLDAAFQARHLAVPMSQAFCVDAAAKASTAAALLRERRFDQAPVLAGGRIDGFVLTQKLDDPHVRHVRDVVTPLGSGNVVSADASVGKLLEWIIDPGFLYVLEGRDITGFITVSDFNKQPARGYLYLLLARLEVGIAALIRHRFAPDQSGAVALLSPEGQNAVTERYQDDEQAHEEAEWIAYFDFSDLINVVNSDDILRSWIGRGSRRSWHRETGGLVKLRNQVMHPVRNVVLTKGGLISLRRREQRIRRLIADVEQAVEDRAS